MAERNPYGAPPRTPPHGRGVVWYGERWYTVDACAAVGIHVNTFLLRRREHGIARSLLPTGRPRTKPAPKPRPHVPTRAELATRIEQLAAMVEPPPTVRHQMPRAFDIICGECQQPAVVLSPSQKHCNPCRYRAAGYEVAA